MTGYPNISDHGIIGDLQTAALVATDGTIWHPRTKAFTQHYDTDVLDSSLLLMPLEGFISPTDPMWLATLEAMDSELVSDSLVYRYNPATSPDGLRGDEGTFSLCTFL